MRSLIKWSFVHLMVRCYPITHVTPQSLLIWSLPVSTPDGSIQETPCEIFLASGLAKDPPCWKMIILMRGSRKELVNASEYRWNTVQDLRALYWELNCWIRFSMAECFCLASREVRFSCNLGQELWFFQLEKDVRSIPAKVMPRHRDAQQGGHEGSKVDLPHLVRMMMTVMLMMMLMLLVMLLMTSGTSFPSRTGKPPKPFPGSAFFPAPAPQRTRGVT